MTASFSLWPTCERGRLLPAELLRATLPAAVARGGAAYEAAVAREPRVSCTWKKKCGKNGEKWRDKSWILTVGDIAESCLMKEFCRDLYRSWAGKVWHLMLHEEREASDLPSVFCAAFLVETRVIKIHLARKEYARVLQYPTVNTWWMMTNADADADSCWSWWHRGLTS